MKEVCGHDEDFSSYTEITRTADNTMAVWTELADTDNNIKNAKEITV